jgi:hypothetical protein
MGRGGSNYSCQANVIRTYFFLVQTVRFHSPARGKEEEIRNFLFEIEPDTANSFGGGLRRRGLQTTNAGPLPIRIGMVSTWILSANRDSI